ncbi:MAG: sugar isomerase domain-containing protein [Anaerolineaceae bacterium]|nr:sugar isomerase domain-containing protein [Anaerolineaceae bacterium]
MSAIEYIHKMQKLIQRLEDECMPDIQKAAGYMADSIAAGRVVWYFGSGHSTLPTLDVMPRYGSYIGLQPIYDPNISWMNVMGPGGTPEVLWIEKQEGYVANVLRYYNLDERDTMILISHGGTNSAAIEAGMIAQEKGIKTVVLTSKANLDIVEPRHSSGKVLANVGDVVIDNVSPPEDSLIHPKDWTAPVAASSTVTVLSISMMLVAETAHILAERGIEQPTFVSPCAVDDPDHNLKVYDAYREFRHKIY